MALPEENNEKKKRRKRNAPPASGAPADGAEPASPAPAKTPAFKVDGKGVYLSKDNNTGEFIARDDAGTELGRSTDQGILKGKVERGIRSSQRAGQAAPAAPKEQPAAPKEAPAPAAQATTTEQPDPRAKGGKFAGLVSKKVAKNLAKKNEAEAAQQAAEKGDSRATGGRNAFVARPKDQRRLAKKNEAEAKAAQEAAAPEQPDTTETQPAAEQKTPWYKRLLGGKAKEQAPEATEEVQPMATRQTMPEQAPLQQQPVQGGQVPPQNMPEVDQAKNKQVLEEYDALVKKGELGAASKLRRDSAGIPGLDDWSSMAATDAKKYAVDQLAKLGAGATPAPAAGAATTGADGATPAPGAGITGPGPTIPGSGGGIGRGTTAGAGAAVDSLMNAVKNIQAPPGFRPGAGRGGGAYYPTQAELYPEQRNILLGHTTQVGKYGGAPIFFGGGNILPLGVISGKMRAIDEEKQQLRKQAEGLDLQAGLEEVKNPNYRANQRQLVNQTLQDAYAKALEYYNGDDIQLRADLNTKGTWVNRQFFGPGGVIDALNTMTREANQIFDTTERIIAGMTVPDKGGNLALERDDELLDAAFKVKDGYEYNRDPRELVKNWETLRAIINADGFVKENGLQKLYVDIVNSSADVTGPKQMSLPGGSIIQYDSKTTGAQIREQFINAVMKNPAFAGKISRERAESFFPAYEKEEVKTTSLSSGGGGGGSFGSTAKTKLNANWKSIGLVDEATGKNIPGEGTIQIQPLQSGAGLKLVTINTGVGGETANIRNPYLTYRPGRQDFVIVGQKLDEKSIKSTQELEEKIQKAEEENDTEKAAKYREELNKQTTTFKQTQATTNVNSALLKNLFGSADPYEIYARQSGMTADQIREKIGTLRGRREIGAAMGIPQEAMGPIDWHDM